MTEEQYQTILTLRLEDKESIISAVYPHGICALIEYLNEHNISQEIRDILFAR
jgi:hypothetical protein